MLKPIASEEVVASCHFDTQGIAEPPLMQYPEYQTAGAPEFTIRYMVYNRHFVKGWTDRLEAAAKENKVQWSKLAEEFEVTEAGLRHWRNGTRPPRLDRFFRMCEFAGVDPRYILFGPDGGISRSPLAAHAATTKERVKVKA